MADADAGSSSPASDDDSSLGQFILLILAASVVLMAIATGIHLRSRRRVDGCVDNEPVLGGV